MAKANDTKKQADQFIEDDPPQEQRPDTEQQEQTKPPDSDSENLPADQDTQSPPGGKEQDDMADKRMMSDEEKEAIKKKDGGLRARDITRDADGRYIQTVINVDGEVVLYVKGNNAKEVQALVKSFLKTGEFSLKIEEYEDQIQRLREQNRKLLE